jgi:LuxR family maltose regulon positive regulatory protein
MAYWHSGRMAEAEPVLRAALAAAQSSGNDYARLTAQIFLGRVMAVRGELAEAAAACRQIIEEGSPSPVVTLAYLDLASLDYEWNDLLAATEHLRQGTLLAERSGNGEVRLAADLVLARVQSARGDLRAALKAIQHAHDLARTENLPAPALGRIAAAGVEAALAAGDLETAEQWAPGLAADADAHPFYRFLGLTQARLLIARGEKLAAAEMLPRSFETASAAGWGYGAIAARVWQALAAETPDAGQQFMADALRRAQPQRFIRTFADAGPALLPLLHEAARQGIAPDYVGEILLAIGAKARMAAGVASSLIEPLSEREMEVLRLMAAGLSNRAIAEKLILSEGTVKTHIHNICGKLAAANRTEAAARARELKLI